MKYKRKVDYNIVKEIIDCKESGKNSGYMECVIEVADRHNIDIDDIAEMLDDDIIMHLKMEFVKKRMVKDENISNEIKRREQLLSILEWIKD